MLAYRQIKKESFKMYYKSLCDEVVDIVQHTESSGLDVINCISDVYETTWQCPPIEAGIRGIRRTGAIFTDLAGIFKHLRKSEEKFHAEWCTVASEVLSGQTSFSGLSYRGMSAALMATPADTALIFSSPKEFGSDEHLLTFAVETAAYMQAAYRVDLERSDGNMYVNWKGQRTGVVCGEVYIMDEVVGVSVTEHQLGAALRLPRGMEIEIHTRDTIDAIRAWASTVEVPDHDFLMDCLTILKLGNSQDAYRYLNTKLVAAKPLNTKLTAASQFLKNADRRLTNYEVALEERQADYQRVQAALDDEGAVDRAKLYGMLEILVPKYMTSNTFRTYIGYADVRGEHAMFDIKKYKKMSEGWAKFRDNSLAREFARLAKRKAKNEQR
jgi:hypothetical protein